MKAAIPSFRLIDFFRIHFLFQKVGSFIRLIHSLYRMKLFRGCTYKKKNKKKHG